MKRGSLNKKGTTEASALGRRITQMTADAGGIRCRVEHHPKLMLLWYAHQPDHLTL
jgi:hypothetical protein